ncbi:MAG: polysaccharide pyruvyl transferase family protein [Clostridium sp.]|nr:polysaccharide pyruvyl transferase family protein [Clostridium sp.]
MTFLIVEQPVNNRGDESAHRAFVNSLSSNYPDARINILFFEKEEREVNEFRVEKPNVHYINIPTHHRTFAPHRMIKLFMMFNLGMLLPLLPLIRKIRPYYRQADYIICAPGGIDMGGFQNWVHIALLELARKCNKKTIYFARSIGPFPTQTCFNRLFKKKSIRLLHSFEFISLRDSKSQSIARSLGINFVPTIDSAFLYYEPGEIPSTFAKSIGHDYIVLIPNSLAWHHDFKQFSYEDFFRFWVMLTNRLLQEYPDHRIAMLPQTVSYGYAACLPDGYKYFQKIRESADSPERIVVLEEKYGSNIQQAIIAKSKFLIGARYHSIIFSINQNIPFISLCYEHKMSGVTDMIGKKDIKLQDIFNTPPLSPNALETAITTIIKFARTCNADPAAQQLAKEMARKGFMALTEYIDKDQQQHTV